LISRIPTIRRRPAGIGHRLKIPVEIIREGVRSERGLLIVDVVARRGEHRRNRASGECPALLDAVSRCIIGIGQVADDGCALRDRCEPVGTTTIQYLRLTRLSPFTFLFLICAF